MQRVCLVGLFAYIWTRTLCAAEADMSAGVGDDAALQSATMISPSIGLVAEDPVVEARHRRFSGQAVAGAQVPLEVSRQPSHIDRPRELARKSLPERITLSGAESGANIVNQSERLQFRDITERAVGERQAALDLETRQLRVEALRRAAARAAQMGQQ